MGRKLAIETHPQRHEIETRIIEGDSLREIAGQFDVSKSALQRYITTRFIDLAAETLKERDLDHGESILNRIDIVLSRLEKLMNAADEWLTDPNDTNKYDLSPRSDEVFVIYLEELEEGKVVKKKVSLQELINEIEDKGKSIQRVEWKTVDIRTLLPRAADSITKQLNLMAQILGKINTGSADTYNFIQVIEQAYRQRNGYSDKEQNK